jgi:hypothetical protein
LKRNNIHPQRTSVAATFYEPVYQRLRSWSNDSHDYLLGFTAPTNPQTRQVLQDAGAVLSRSQAADCFAELWNLSDAYGKLSPDMLGELDRRIGEALRCHAGRFSAACGHLRWDDNSDLPHRRRHVISQLLEESREPRSRTR